MPAPPRTASSPRTAAVLDELVELFLAEGFRDTNLTALAGRLHCSKSTLYAIGPSKEQMIVAVVRAFFRRSTTRVDARLAATTRPDKRLGTYLLAISDELSPASPAFFADLDAFAPTRDIYTRNTAIAAGRVRELVGGSATRRGVDATFVGAVAGQVMEAINAGRIGEATGLDDARAYRALADLLTAGVSAR
ncbi:MAG: TetR/AcrR family transcriptional regulator [Actinomycetota bacterium]|nr:TetR/AcrR family transcriptional regulator [Actinomycetota bacterium]